MPVTALDVHAAFARARSGRAFGAAGAYEKIAGTIRFAADPAHPLHRTITDIGRAPRNAAGRVEFSRRLLPAEARRRAQGQRAAAARRANRGRKVALGMFNSAVRVPDPDDARGLRQRLPACATATRSRGSAGSPTCRAGRPHGARRRRAREASTGFVRCELRPNARVGHAAARRPLSRPASHGRSRRPAARLTVREHVGAPTPCEVAARAAWRFADAEPHRARRRLQARRDLRPRLPRRRSAARRARLSRRARHRRRGCAGRRGERQPVRRRARARLPLRRLAERAVPAPLALSRPRRGRAGPAGLRRASCRTSPAAGAASSTCASASLRSTRRSRWAACSRSPTSSRPIRVTGRRDGLLARLQARGRLPRIFATNTSAEYWRGDASLIHTDIEARARRGAGRSSRAPISSPARSTRRARCRRPPADPNTGGRGAASLQRRRLRAAAARRARQPRPLGERGRRAAAERVPAHRRRHRGARRIARRVFAGHPGRALSRAHRAAAAPRLRARRSSAASCPSSRRRSARRIATLRLGRRRRRQRGRRHPAGRARGAARDLHRLEPAPSRAGRAGRPHVDDGLDAAVRAHARGARRSAATRARRSPSATRRATAYLGCVRGRREALVAARHVLAEDVEAIVERAGQRWDVVERGL